METEIWKDVVGFEGIYWVSNLGQIKSVQRKGSKGGVMQGHADKKGYINVTLRKDGHQYTKKLHRLVAEAFLPNPDNYLEVNHKNEDKSDNRADNLEWCDSTYNQHYGSRTERANLSCGKPIICIETGKIFNGAAWAAREMSLDPSSITKAVKNPNRTCGGYHWKYVEKETD